MQITITQKKDAKVVNLVGSFTITEVQSFKEAVLPLMKEIEKSIIINMQELNFIDSSGIGQLVSLLNVSKEKNKRIFLVNLNSYITSLFRTVKLQKFFDILTPLDFEMKFR